MNLKIGLMGLDLLIVLVSCASIAQEKPAAEITGAYQFLRLDSVNVPLGGGVSANWSASNWVGLAADFGVATKSESGVSATVYTLAAGPQVTLRSRNIDPYFRLGLGAAHLTASGFGFGGSTTAFLISPAGGADFRVSEHVWFRLGANYPVARKSGVTADGIQTVVGLTYRFGGKRESIRQPPQVATPLQSANSVTVPPSPLGVVVDKNMRIVSILPGSTLLGHGLEVGDVINSIDDKPTKTPEELALILSGLAKGATVKNRLPISRLVASVGIHRILISVGVPLDPVERERKKSAVGRSSLRERSDEKENFSNHHGVGDSHRPIAWRACYGSAGARF